MHLACRCAQHAYQGITHMRVLRIAARVLPVIFRPLVISRNASLALLESSSVRMAKLHAEIALKEDLLSSGSQRASIVQWVCTPLPLRVRVAPTVPKESTRTSSQKKFVRRALQVSMPLCLRRNASPAVWDSIAKLNPARAWDAKWGKKPQLLIWVRATFAPEGRSLIARSPSVSSA